METLNYLSNKIDWLLFLKIPLKYEKYINDYGFNGIMSFNKVELELLYNIAKGENKIKQLITESKNEGWLIQNGNRQPYELGIPSV